MSEFVPRLPLICLLAALAALLPASGAAAAPPDPVALTEGWQYAPDAADAGEAAGWPSGVAGDAWAPVAVPHVFEPRPLEDVFDGTVGWYRLTFAGPATPEGMSWALRFEQVRRSARVWLNGVEIGANRDPYTPFEVPAEGLRPSEPNTLVVRVDNRKGAEPREGWWNWGGMTRPVTLVPRGQVILRDVGLLPRRRCVDGTCRWSVLADGWLENTSASAVSPLVAVGLRAPDGTTSVKEHRTRDLRPGERVRVRFAVPVQGDPAVWWPEDPQLYGATVRTRVGGSVQQVDRHRIGLRTVDVRRGMLRLNGRVLDLRGASIQEDVQGRGPALTEADIEATVRELKELGANVTRAHYLLNERLLERLDEEGILVWSQAPVYHRDELLRTPGGRSYELEVLRDTILEARNHPSVITHSVANELDPEPDDARHTRLWLRRAADVARDLDPTLPVSLDLLSYPKIPKQRTYDDFDLLGINSYYGWYEGKEERSTANLSDLAPYLRAMRRKYPRHAMVITEFGAESTDRGPADVKQTFAFQSEYVRRNLEIVERLGFMGGSIYWTLREFAVKPRWDGGAHPEDRDSIHNKGLIAYDGSPKPAWNVAAASFRATPLFRGDPRAVAVAQLSAPSSGIGGGLLVGGVLAVILALLALDLWCVRDILRARTPRDPAPAGEVVALRRVA